MTTRPTITPARAARRQLLTDRITEYLTEKCGDHERATGYANAIRAIVDDLGFTLPEALDDPPPLRPARADTDGPGYAAFQAARNHLAARRTDRDTPTHNIHH